MKKVILGVVAACVLAGIGTFLWWVKAPNRTILRNSSGADITDVRLSVQSLDGTETLSKKAERLGIGESLVLRHSFNDSTAKVSFCLEGKDHKYAGDYVDLWTGESWVLDVMRDGSIRAGYQSTRER